MSTLGGCNAIPFVCADQGWQTEVIPSGRGVKSCDCNEANFGGRSIAALHRRNRQQTKEIDVEQILINLVAGALGGVGAGKSSPTFDLGTIGNVVAGLVGGGLLGQIVTLLLPSVVAAAQAGNLSVGGVVSQAIAGGAGGAILTAVIGAIKNKAAA